MGEHPFSSMWMDRFMELARHVSQWSKDPKTQVGAAIIHASDHRIVSVDYNGFARGIAHTPERLADPVKNMLMLHAEENAALNARCDLSGCVMFVSARCCAACLSRVRQMGLRLIYIPVPHHDPFEGRESWRVQCELGCEVASEAGVQLRYWPS